jgi:hypothetical protein
VIVWPLLRNTAALIVSPGPIFQGIRTDAAGMSSYRRNSRELGGAVALRSCAELLERDGCRS